MAENALNKIRMAGVAGAGGAGFPTYAKLNAQVDTIILNAAECEPLLHKDKEILRHHLDTVLEGFSAAAGLTGASQAFIGIKEKYQDLIDHIRESAPAGIEVVTVRDAYPSGDEITLVYHLTGRIVPPGEIPLAAGAVVINVETSYNLARALRGYPVTEKFVPVAGDVADPCTLRVPIGISFEECINAAGGQTTDSAAYLIGGVMMGRLEQTASGQVTRTTGGIIVLPSDHPVVARYNKTWKEKARVGRSACDQCGFCTELCPRYLLGHPIEPHLAMRSLVYNNVGDSLVKGTSFCCECNLCSLYACPEALDPKDACVWNKTELAKQDKKWDNPDFRPSFAENLLPNRQVPTSKLMSRLGLNRFNNRGPLKKDPLVTKRVGLALKQHIGAAASPDVHAGDQVNSGDIIASVPRKGDSDQLGLPIHASISGRIAEITEDMIWIES